MGSGLSITSGTLNTTNNGTVTSIATSAPLTGGPITSTGTIGITQANSTTNGFLSSTDWNTFNNKLSAEVDGSTTNELQNLSLTGQSLGISSGSGVTLPIIDVAAGTGVTVSKTGGVATVSATSTGTVSSVGLTMPTGFTVSNSPVTTSGTLAVTTALNGPLRGDGTGFTTGNTNLASEVTGTLPVANGGTGATTLTANKVLVGNGTSAILSPANLHWDNGNSRLGIGTASPTDAIDVNGTARVRSFTGTPTRLIGADGTGLLDTVIIGTGLTLSGGTLSASGGGGGGGSGTVTSVGLSAFTGLTVTGSPVTTSGTLALANGLAANKVMVSNGTTGYLAPTELHWDDNLKRLGLGVASPNQQLELSNSMRLPITTGSTIGVIYKDGDRFIHDYTPAGILAMERNLFIGNAAGNFTGSGANSSNVGIGNSVLSALTTGRQNIAIGKNSLKALTQASGNVAIGFEALTALSTTSSNNYNIAIGYTAGNTVSTGSNNTVCESSIFIGAVTKPAANSGTNQIVIGHNATGAGSNTVTLGNTSVVRTVLRSNVDIGGNLTSSAANWGTNGVGVSVTASTYTNSTAGNQATLVANSFAQPTFAANAAQTTTSAATMYIADSPAAGTNMTITNPYSLWVDAGNSRFDGSVIIDESVTGKITSGTFVSTPNYSPNNVDSSKLQITVGTDALPSPSKDAVAVFQKITNSTWTSGSNPTVYVSAKKTTGGTNHSAVALFAEGQDDYGDDGGSPNSFVEGIRAHGIVTKNNGSTHSGSGYGIVTMAGTNTGIRSRYLIGIESAIYDNGPSDPPAQLNRDSFTASFLATTDGLRDADVAFLTNPYTTKKFIRGFVVAPNTAKTAAFSTLDTTVIGLDLANGKQSFAALTMPNNTPVRIRNAASSSLLNVMYLDGSDKLILGAGTASLAFQTNTSNTSVDRVTILNNGNVGIRTSSPSNTLHVNGVVRIDSLTPSPTKIIGADASGKVGQVTLGAGISLNDGTLSASVQSITGTSPVNVTSGATPVVSLSDNYGDTKNPYGSKNANLVLAGPASGSAAVPAFRALVPEDIPVVKSTAINSATTISSNDLTTSEYVIAAEMGGGDYTLTLPDPSASVLNKKITVVVYKASGTTNTVTINTSLGAVNEFIYIGLLQTSISINSRGVTLVCIYDGSAYKWAAIY